MKNFNSPSRGAGLSVVIFVSLLLAACDPSLGSRDSLPPEQAEQAPLGQAEDEEPEVDPDTGLPVFSDCAALQEAGGDMGASPQQKIQIKLPSDAGLSL